MKMGKKLKFLYIPFLFKLINSGISVSLADHAPVLELNINDT